MFLSYSRPKPWDSGVRLKVSQHVWSLLCDKVKPVPHMSITRSNSKSTIRYQMSNRPLAVASCHKYLGIFIQDDLQWDTQVREVKTKASKILGLLRRSLSSCSNYVKEEAHNSLVRSCVEYASPCLSPFEICRINSTCCCQVFLPGLFLLL